MAAWALAAALGSVASASDSFLANVRKAQARVDPAERKEYYSRAIAAWTASDGNALLSAARFGRGQAEYELDEPADAAADLSQAIALDPNNDAAYLLRGKALLRLSRPAQAARDLSSYTSVKPEDEEGWLALGEARGFDAQAFRQAARIEPSDFRPAVGLARASMKAKNFKGALRSLAGARQPEALSAKAECETALGQGQAALSDYDAALRAFDAKLDAMTRSEAAPVEIAITRAEAERTRAAWDALLGRATKAAPAAKRRRKTRVKNDPGDRIYAN